MLVSWILKKSADRIPRSLLNLARAGLLSLLAANILSRCMGQAQYAHTDITFRDVRALLPALKAQGITSSRISAARITSPQQSSLLNGLLYFDRRGDFTTPGPIPTSGPGNKRLYIFNSSVPPSRLPPGATAVPGSRKRWLYVFPVESALNYKNARCRWGAGPGEPQNPGLPLTPDQRFLEQEGFLSSPMEALLQKIPSRPRLELTFPVSMDTDRRRILIPFPADVPSGRAISVTGLKGRPLSNGMWEIAGGQAGKHGEVTASWEYPDLFRKFFPMLVEADDSDDFLLEALNGIVSNDA
ncbi:MAG: hypothetical protein HZB91_14030 [Elusimicrobia bacterium]|nr:hypothetical protein [Elusimicrobiota bacterium]